MISAYEEIGLSYEQAVMLDNIIDRKNRYKINATHAKHIMNDYPNLSKYIAKEYNSKKHTNTYYATMFLVLAVDEMLASSSRYLTLDKTNTLDKIKTILARDGYEIKEEEYNFSFKKDNKEITITYCIEG